MNKFLRDDTIVTVSTGLRDKTAIGIIRISGSLELKGLQKFLNLKKLKPRYAHFVKLTNDVDELLDEGIALYFPGPNSYTGEDVLELQVHGNPVQLERIKKYIVNRFGYNNAFPGEFTYRAYKNKKLTISQIEGLDLILNADNVLAIDSGLSTLNGELFGKYGDLKESFLNLNAALEMATDFSEDIGEEEASSRLLEHINVFSEKLTELYKGCEGQLSSLTTPSICFFGKTNAGKSTLFNKVLNSKRSIVSDIEGTTRDYISENYYVDDYSFRLLDTAGLRVTTDEIEKAGIEKTTELMSRSFFKIYVCNPLAEDISKIDVDGYDCFIFTHNDRSGFERAVNTFGHLFKDVCCFSSSESGPIEPLFNTGGGPIEPLLKNKSGPIGPKTNNSFIGPIGPLNREIWSKFSESKASIKVDIPRQRELICSIYETWITLDDSEISDLGILSMKIQEVSYKLDDLIGALAPDTVLNHIFNNFCIGK